MFLQPIYYLRGIQHHTNVIKRHLEFKIIHLRSIFFSFKRHPKIFLASPYILLFFLVFRFVLLVCSRGSWFSTDSFTSQPLSSQLIPYPTIFSLIICPNWGCNCSTSSGKLGLLFGIPTHNTYISYEYS